MTDNQETQKGFKELGLSSAILKPLDKLGYEVPSPIQQATIPPLLEGKDLIGQAQTGTGKTAAFALPLLANLDLKRDSPQVLVLAPTRELAIQVAEAFQRYASGMDGFRVAPIYGGQEISPQIKKLKRGLHVVVGTPGRVMDHMRRGTLKLNQLSCLVLDEADEMLQMGFIEDIEWIMEAVPKESQIALFSATLPAPIRKIARRYMKDPVEIAIEQAKATTSKIRQRYWMVSGLHKMSALTRILEVEIYDAILIFVRTRTMTTDLATKLESQGFSAQPLNGDMTQAKREATVAQFKKGKLDILVATDVAARGLDIDRIRHVINYDIPHNVEAYIHRIGRTGRAGRSGDAVLFVAPRERGLLRQIERTMDGQLEAMDLPTAENVYDVRVQRFKESMSQALTSDKLGHYRDIVESFRQEQNMAALDIAAALAQMLHVENPLDIARDEKKKKKPAKKKKGSSSRESSEPRDRGASIDRSEKRVKEYDKDFVAKPGKKKKKGQRGFRMDRYRIDVGEKDGVLPTDLVTIFSDAAGLDRKHVGTIDISKDVTFIELPEGMPNEVRRELQNIEIAGKKSNFALASPTFQSHHEKKRRR